MKVESVKELSAGDVVIWTRKLRTGVKYLMRGEVIYRTEKTVALKIANGETRFADPEHIRRPRPNPLTLVGAIP